MIRKKVKCAVCKTYRADRFCMIKAKNICWHCCNEIRAKGNCPSECEFAPKQNKGYSINVKVFSLSEMLDLFKKQADFWFIKPNPALGNKSPMEIYDSQEGKKQLEEYFSKNKIPAYYIAKIYKEKFNISSIDLDKYPKPQENFEKTAKTFLDNLILRDWDKIKDMLHNKIYQDDKIFQNYINRTLSIKDLKKLKHYNILKSGLSNDKTQAMVHFEINGKNDLLLIMVKKDEQWCIKERILADISLFYSRAQIVKELANYLSKDMLNEAYRILNGFSKIFIDYADWYYYFAKYYEIKKKYDSAIENMLTATELEPEFIPFLNELGILYVNTNQHEKAKDIWEKMLKIDKNNKIALNNLGIYYLQNKNNKKAKDLFEQCLQIDPNFENAKKNLELIKTETGQS